MNVRLPFGLILRDGSREQRVVLKPLDGQGELAASEQSDPIRALLAVLRHATAQLGPLSGGELDERLLAQLIPLDLDYLGVQVARVSYGDRSFHPVLCPDEACGEKVDIAINLSSITAENIPTHATLELPLSSGQTVRFRLPNVADRLELTRSEPSETAGILVGRCAQEALPLTLPAEERQRIAATLLEASPRLDLSGDFPCVHCGKLFRFELDPVGLAIDRLRASRTRLLQEVHTLAFYYHWSFPDILALPRATRHEFLDLIGDQLEGRRSWR